MLKKALDSATVTMTIAGMTVGIIILGIVALTVMLAGEPWTNVYLIPSSGVTITGALVGLYMDLVGDDAIG